jgi:hypothetical protein
MAGRSRVRNGQKQCSKCERWLGLQDFADDVTTSSGKRSQCRKCYNERQVERRDPDEHAARAREDRSRNTQRADARAEKTIRETERAARALAKEREGDAARARRIASSTAALRPEDFDVSVANDPSTPAVRATSAQAAAEKRQEYSARMGEFAENTRSAAVRANTDKRETAHEDMPPESGTYIGALAEQEHRFRNRRLARSLSLTAANEELARRLFMQTAEEYFAGKITPTGYARKPHGAPIKRTVCCMLSDLHIGADLSAVDNPTPFGAVEEARRLEYILRQTIDYKPQYRKNSELLLAFNGDGIEGLLLHDLRDGAPLAEQQAAFLSHMMTFIGTCSAQFPRVRMKWVPGNHGRNKLRHPGRATSSKWDGIEYMLGYTLQMATRNLRNVTWDVDEQGHLQRKPYAIAELYGQYMGFTHADTEIKLGHPDKKADDNFKQLLAINSTRRYGVEFAAWGGGHYHTGRHQMCDGMHLLWNPALIPPNGHARTSGYPESCGQFVWEAVEGHPVGDVRLCEVGPAQDRDERLGSLIRPFRFAL